MSVLDDAASLLHVKIHTEIVTPIEAIERKVAYVTTRVTGVQTSPKGISTSVLDFATSVADFATSTCINSRTNIRERMLRSS